jgi:hypothetical protein
MLDEFTDPQLVRDRQAALKNAADLDPLARRYEELREGPPSYRVDVELEALRPRLAALYRQRDVLAQCIPVREERQHLVNVLMQAERRENAALHTERDRLATSLTPPETEPVRRIYQRVRNLNNLRHTLHDITGDARYARPFDLFAELRAEWEAQHAARTRIFTHTLAPGFRPSPEAAPWADTLARLRELEAPSTHKEPIHAVR